MPIIEATNLAKKYPLPDNSSESFYAVNGVSLSIEAGGIFGILGPDGAGKTTTLEMLEELSDIGGCMNDCTYYLNSRAYIFDYFYQKSQPG